MSLKELFPYKYVGGGYFRKKNTPKGKVAEILHTEWEDDKHLVG